MFSNLLLFMLGVLSALVGTAAAFWHVHWTIAVIFSIVTLIALLAYFHYERV